MSITAQIPSVHWKQRTEFIYVIFPKEESYMDDELWLISNLTEDGGKTPIGQVYVITWDSETYCPATWIVA